MLIHPMGEMIVGDFLSCKLSIKMGNHLDQKPPWKAPMA